MLVVASNCADFPACWCRDFFSL